jgi:hypothetical protein
MLSVYLAEYMLIIHNKSKHFFDKAELYTKGKDGTFQKPGRSEKKLDRSITCKIRKDYCVVNRITFSFERHGVFVHKGVGRGYQMQGGMVVRTAKSKTTEIRQSAEWFNPVLDKALPELADKLAEINADAVVKAMGMMIK